MDRKELNTMQRELPKWIWLFMPILLGLMPYLARLRSLETDQYMYGEFGVIENITVVFLLVAIVASVLFLRARVKTNFRIFNLWMIIFLLGSIYYAGEEISWGQHFFGWGTPEEWTTVNDQQETNLHNTSPIFDQIPRALLSVAALLGGVFVPIYRRFKGHVPNKNVLFDWVWPTYVCLPAALLAMLVSWHEKIYEVLGVDIPPVLDIRAGETKELFLAMFMMLYALSVWYRNKNVNN